jgi:nucleoside-diphosphate-sugar epimerase
MESNLACDFIVGQDDPILITGATGFIGSKLVANLLNRGFRNIRCFARNANSAARIDKVSVWPGAAGKVEIITGNLLSRQDCISATKDVAVIFHLAAGRGEKSYPDAFMNSVVTTRNLLDASIQQKTLRRFVNVSSFAVYTNTNKLRRTLDESCPVETRPELRGEAYCFAKVKQDDIVVQYANKVGIPLVIVRPGVVYGPGNEAIHGRVGIGTFGVFLHLGGSNVIPFTYIDNCADAIALAGLKKGTEGQVFNVVDDDLPSSSQFLRAYKRQVRKFKSVYVPHSVSYALCWMWERYSAWSQGQLPPVFNRKRWHANWKRTHYSNAKLKRIGWIPPVSTAEGLRSYFKACRNGGPNA